MALRIVGAALVEAAETAAMIFVVAFGPLVLNQFLNLSGMPEDIPALLQRLEASPLPVVACIIAVHVVRGMFLDGMLMIFLTLPIFMPVIAQPDFGMADSLIRWGILTVPMVETGLITPPVGLNVCMIKGMLPEVPLSRIVRGIAPFVLADLALLLPVLTLPALVLRLPRAMF